MLHHQTPGREKKNEYVFREEKEDKERNDPSDHNRDVDAETTNLWHPEFLRGCTVTLTTLRALWSLPEIRLGLSEKSQQRVLF